MLVFTDALGCRRHSKSSQHSVSKCRFGDYAGSFALHTAATTHVKTRSEQSQACVLCGHSSEVEGVV